MGQRITGKKREPTSDRRSPCGGYILMRCKGWEKPVTQGPKKTFSRRKCMKDAWGGKKFLGVFEHQESSPKFAAWWRCNRRGSQGRDYVELTSQGRSLDFILPTMESFQNVSSRGVTWSIKQLQKSQPSRVTAGGTVWNPERTSWLRVVGTRACSKQDLPALGLQKPSLYLPEMV